MTKNQMQIVLSRGGEELRLGPKEAIDITDVTGLESAEFVNQMLDPAHVDGEDLEGKKIGARIIHLEAAFRSHENNSENRQRLIRFFNPKFDDADLYVNNMGVERHIHYEIEGFTIVKQQNLDNRLKFVVDLRCPNPYMLNISDFGKDLAEISPQYAFPWMVTKEKVRGIQQPYKGVALGGKIMGYRTVTTRTGIKNDGDVAASVRVIFIAKGGVVVNPVIRNESVDKFVRVVVTMQEGDELMIDTNERKQRIELNGVSVYQKIDRKSSPFLLDVGTSVIGYSADEGYMNLKAVLYYTPHYLGV